MFLNMCLFILGQVLSLANYAEYWLFMDRCIDFLFFYA
jgi:hypothetical protein